MAYRGRPVNRRLYFPELEDKLDDWLKKSIIDGDADNYVWDRLDGMDTPEIMRTFGSIIEFVVKNGDADDMVKNRAKELGWEPVE